MTVFDRSPPGTPEGAGSDRVSRRDLPAVDRLLASEPFAALLAVRPRAQVLRAMRRELARLRQAAGDGPLPPEAVEPAAIRARVDALLAAEDRPYYRRVINASGVVLHTNLGRAPLAGSAVEALAATAGGAQRLEVDLESGRRGGRDAGVAALLCELTGAEAATAVNNNAAATLLVLAALARGRRVVLSRGEMVEIGGSYRVPEILRESGAVLAEVGTTNRTHLTDYRRALEEGDAGMLLKVHASNYRIEGFTAEVEIEELVALGREHGVPVVHDLGSGCLVELPAAADEPPVRRSVAAGADLVCFSGDKLVGGPQAGLLAGSRAAVERCRRHPLFRALRPGRLTYTALEATLRLYRDGAAEAIARVPALDRLTASPDRLAARAERLARALADIDGVEAEAVECASQAGSGSIPARALASRGVRVVLAGRSPDELAAALRDGEPPVIVRLHDGAVLLDVRTLADGEVAELAGRLQEIAARRQLEGAG